MNFKVIDTKFELFFLDEIENISIALVTVLFYIKIPVLSAVEV